MKTVEEARYVIQPILRGSMLIAHCEIRRRWETLLGYGRNTHDLKQAVISGDSENPCENGLRSVCWKIFLLCDDLDRSKWIDRLTDTRSAYDSLKDHFLKYIKHPNDLQSTVDPLAEDEESPWQALRHDEATRAEIFQDVERCLQDNCFFREPSTKSMMLDILFVYSKLNPDLGYRQGMHELLAPILWVVERDAVTQSSKHIPVDTTDDESVMLQLLDANYIESDSFNLFCSVMQVARSFYEHTDNRPVNGEAEMAPIVARSEFIHNELLMVADHELAIHLNTIEILPQIFLTRWIRLLFGREFSFDDTLLIWDLLFANGLRATLIDHICVAMLLRIRWQRQPPQLARDPLQQPPREPSLKKIDRRSHSRDLSGGSSSGQSPARNSQRTLESLFQDVSEGLQRRTEGWGVAKAVRGAVSEAKRNMANAEVGGISPSRAWRGSPRFGTPRLRRPRTSDPVDLVQQVASLKKRDNSLAGLLSEAIHDLSLIKEYTVDLNPEAMEALDRAVERIKNVQTELQGSSGSTKTTSTPTTSVEKVTSDKPGLLEREEEKQDAIEQKSTETTALDEKEQTDTKAETSNADTDFELVAPSASPSAPDPPLASRFTPTPLPRRPLAQSEFSWMLGDNTHRSSFVSSASLPPDQSRRSESRSRQGSLFGDGRDEKREQTQRDEDSLSLNSFT
uniref:TBC1 domain family member 5 n=1 Tax=Talaromyces marneffei PM1 TaxID=1077442 RepID=A0A093XE90_TALMA